MDGVAATTLYSYNARASKALRGYWRLNMDIQRKLAEWRSMREQREWQHSLAGCQ